MTGKAIAIFMASMLSLGVSIAHAESRDHDRQARHAQRDGRSADRNHDRGGDRRVAERHWSNDRDARRPQSHAQSPQRRDDRWDRRDGHRFEHRDDRRYAHRPDRRPDSHWNDGRWDDRRYVVRHYDHGRYEPPRVVYRHYDRPRYRVARYEHPYGYRPYRWYAGARLPVAYCAPRYIVHDYYSYGLRRPPYGYHWIRVDSDVVLAAITTGIVLEVVDQIFW